MGRICGDYKLPAGYKFAVMFVKWSQRSREYDQSRRYWREQPPHRTVIAQLVESHRVDGKAHQRIIAHLGTCREPVGQVNHRRWFYERCSRVLDGLNLAAAERAKIDAALAERIPPPTAEEITASKRAFDELMTSFRPDPLAALIRAWNATSPNDRKRFFEMIRQQITE